jgi:ATP-dependent Clp protease ATP-binding subunit ClpA
LIEKGFDAKMGARPLQRVIDKDIKRDLAKMMLFGDLKNGGIITIGIVDNQLVIIPKVKIAKLEYHEQSSTDQS